MSNLNTTLKKELRVVPAWAYVVAIFAFVGLQIPLGILLRREPNPAPIPLQITLQIFSGVILGIVVMLIGYVNQDAKLRNMNRTLWTLLVIFIPNAIGFILYFLLRQPRSIPCPQCGALMEPEGHFCPKKNGHKH